VKREWPVLAFTLVFPTVLAYGYFVAFANDPTPEGQPWDGRQAGPNLAALALWTTAKVVQILLPVAWLGLTDPAVLRWQWPDWRALVPGVVFSLLVMAAMFGLYFGLLRDGPVLKLNPDGLRRKVVEFGLQTPQWFLLFAILISLAHSLLEEYYWRWFLFGRLRRQMPVMAAAILSSVGFLAFHVIDLAKLFPGRFWTVALPLGLCVGVGGVVWCWLYQRTGTIASPWISHLLVDLAMFAVGYDLCFR
jgi:membrane protease YdiL (CAAX protease family)